MHAAGGSLLGRGRQQLDARLVLGMPAPEGGDQDRGVEELPHRIHSTQRFPHALLTPAVNQIRNGDVG
jgi:hypothetical protein